MTSAPTRLALATVLAVMIAGPATQSLADSNGSKAGVRVHRLMTAQKPEPVEATPTHEHATKPHRHRTAPVKYVRVYVRGARLGNGYRVRYPGVARAWSAKTTGSSQLYRQKSDLFRSKIYTRRY